MTRHEMLFRESADTLERRDAAARPRTFNEEQRTIEAVIASSAPVARRDQRGEFDEILSAEGLDLEGVRGVSLLDAHSQAGVGSILGSVIRAWREGDHVIAELRLSERADAALIADVRSGVVQHLSVGYVVHEWRDGESNGRRTRTAVRWEIKEASFVPVPADRNARTRQHGDGEIATRNRAIIEQGRRLNISQGTIDALLCRGATIEEASSEMLRHLETRSALGIRAGGEHRTLDNPVEFQRAAGEALFARVHRSHNLSAPARQYADAPMASIAAECLRRSGESVTLMQPAAIITRALQTTSDFPMILGEAVGRVLREAYKAAPSGLRRLARLVTLPDFRERAALTLDPTSFTLEKTNEHGEYKSGGFVETGEKYKLATYGKIFGLTRQAIINDDLGALSDVPAKLGAQAASFEADYLADLLQSGSGFGPTLSDGDPLFDPAHANLAGPAGAAPDDTALSAARLAMRKQIGPAGKLIDVTPRYLVVPSELETAGEKLLATIAPVTVDEVNPWSFLSLIVEPRLTSATAWYLAADAPQSGLEVAYLSGSEGPQTETQAGFRIDGVEVKVRLDFVAAFVDWRGMYMNPGAPGGGA